MIFIHDSIPPNTLKTYSCRRRDYLNAYGAYEAAAEKYLGTVDEEPDHTTCKENMAKIKDMQKNPDLNVGFKRPRWDNERRSLFYPAASA
jgi:hypothetical protein